MVTLQQMLQSWGRFGILDVVLPFLLIFTIIYAILLKTQVLSTEPKRNRKFSLVLALVIGLLVVMPHAIDPGAPNDGRLGGSFANLPDVVDIVNNSLPSISIWIVALLMLMLLLGMFGADITKAKHPVGTLLIAITTFVVVYVFGNAAGWWRVPTFLGGMLNNPANQATLLIILIFGLIVYFVVREDEGDDTDTDTWKHSFKRMFD